MKSIIAVFACLLIVGCSSSDITSPDQIVFPASNVSYRLQVAPYLQISCNTQGCHDEPNSANQGITLTSRVQVLSNRVTLAKDTMSPIVLVMKGLDPKHTGTFLANSNQIRGITVWVWEGALDN